VLLIFPAAVKLTGVVLPAAVMLASLFVPAV
jgi:hypothetical protein